MNRFYMIGKIVNISKLKLDYNNNYEVYIILQIEEDKNFFDIYCYHNIGYILRNVCINSYMFIDGYIHEKRLISNKFFIL